MLNNKKSHDAIYKVEYRHSMEWIEKEFVSFAFVRDKILPELMKSFNLVQKIPKFQEFSAYYLNFFFKEMVCFICTFWIIGPTSQKTQEKINGDFNRIYRSSNLFGGKIPQKKYRSIKNGSLIQSTRELETMITTFTKFEEKKILKK